MLQEEPETQNHLNLQQEQLARQLVQSVTSFYPEAMVLLVLVLVVVLEEVVAVVPELAVPEVLQSDLVEVTETTETHREEAEVELS